MGDKYIDWLNHLSIKTVNVGENQVEAVGPTLAYNPAFGNPYRAKAPAENSNATPMASSNSTMAVSSLPHSAVPRRPGVAADITKSAVVNQWGRHERRP